jgi:hypothetical protein
MIKKDFFAGVFLLVLSAVLYYQTRQLSIWGDLGPAEGFFPLLLSLLLGALSLAIILKAWFGGRGTPEDLSVLGPQKGKLFLYFGTFLAFALIFKTIGYSLTVAGYFVFILKILERQSWKVTISVVLVSIVTSYLMFNLFLAVPLPEGILLHLFQK